MRVSLAWISLWRMGRIAGQLSTRPRATTTMLDTRSTRSTGLIYDGDTVIWKIALGERVRCIVGDLKGIKGIVVEARADSRVLIRIGRGEFIELPRICVERLPRAEYP
jgi:hypothetical protein